MTVYTIALELGTNDDCPSPQAAAIYFAAVVAGGSAEVGTVTVTNTETGESTEEFIPANGPERI